MKSKIAILGQMEVRAADHVLPLGPPKQRVVFATLLVRPGQVVPVERIIDAVWPGGAPDRVRNQVHVYISSIRRLLAGVDGFSGAVRTESLVGYSIDLDRSELDLLVFEDSVAAARRILASGRVREAADEFGAALALWRGPALGGVPGEFAEREAAQLEERRIAVLEQHLDLRSTLGQHGWIIPELAEMVERKPLHEGLRRRLMLALYHVGRSVDALAVFREGRRLLVEELGVEPGPELQSAHQTILDGTPPEGSSSMVDHHARVDVAATHVQLPAGTASLVGRDEELADIGLLLGHNDERCAILVTGAVGVGKTALAVSAARKTANLFPGGVFFAELGGGAHPADPAQVLAELLQAAGVASSDVPEGLTARSAAFRAALTSRRALIVLDGAIDSNQVDPLLPQGAEYAALMTSSASLSELQCTRIDLRPLAAADARRLLAEIAGASRVDDEAQSAEVLVQLCDRLPLAVRGIAAKLAARPHWRLAQAVEALGAAGGLDQMSTSDLALRDRLMSSYQRLGELAQRTLRLIGLLDLPDFPGWVIAALLDETSTSATVDAIDELVNLHLLEVIPRRDNVRYRLSNVVRTFTLEVNRGDDESLAKSEPALLRAMDGYIDLAVRANARVTTDFVGLVEHAPFSWHVPSSEAERMLHLPLEWFDTERVGLYNVIGQLVSIGDVQRAGTLACALSTFFEMRNLFDDWRRSHELVLTAAGGDEAGYVVARLHRGLGELWTIQDRYDHAMTHFQAAVRSVENTQYISLWAAALAGMGCVSRLTGDYESALQHFHRAAELCLRAGNEAGDAYAAIGLGIVYLENNQLERAHAHFTDGLVISRRIGYRPGIAQGLRALGHVSLRQGQRQDAAAYFERARSYSASLNDRVGIAHAELWLGVVRIEQGATRSGTTLLTDSLSTYREFDNLFGQACALDALGRASLAAGQSRQAMTHVVEAIWIWRRINSRYRLAASLDLQAALAKDLGDGERAHAATHESHTIRASLTLPIDLPIDSE